MMYVIFLYLLKATFCLVAFSLVYRWCFSRLTHFHWMRFYLVFSVAFSITLPFIQVPAYMYAPFLNFEPIAASSGYFNFDPTLFTTENALPVTDTAVQNQSLQLWPLLGYLLLGIYLLGVFYKLGITLRNLLSIRQLIQRNQGSKEQNHHLVYLQKNMPAFSFGKYIFLNSDIAQLSADEQQQIKQHELVHVQQKHTLDLLFFEVAGALFWFNPLMIFLKKTLREVHEFLADVEVAGRQETQKAYAHLILKLAARPTLVPLGNGISGKQISQRIMMLTKARSLPVQKLTFLLIFPMVAILLFLNSCMDEPTNTQLSSDDDLQQTVVNGKKIRNIVWEDNKIYDDETLNRTLGLKKGDVYNDEILKKHLSYNPDGSDVSSLYMNQGYLFFDIDVEEQKVSEDESDLIFKVFEGQKSTFRNIIIKGNKTVSTDKILQEIPFKSGDLFNRSQLIEAQKAIAAMGYFDPKEVSIYPYPQWENHVEGEMVNVDWEFTVIETNPKK